MQVSNIDMTIFVYFLTLPGISIHLRDFALQVPKVVVSKSFHFQIHHLIFDIKIVVFFSFFLNEIIKLPRDGPLISSAATSPASAVEDSKLKLLAKGSENMSAD